MWIVIDLLGCFVQADDDGNTFAFPSRADAERWDKREGVCQVPFYVEIPDELTGFFAYTNPLEAEPESED